MKTAIIALGVALAVPAAAEEAHTAMWYVAHPQDLRHGLIECRNDPGNQRLHHQCVNIDAAMDILRVRGDDAALGLMTPPSNPAYWRLHPDELGPKIALCRNFSPSSSQWHTLFCDSAHEAEGR